MQHRNHVHRSARAAVSSKRVLSAAVATAIASLVPAGAAHATDYTWNVLGGGTQSWNSPANWTPNSGFPGVVTDVANLQVGLTNNLSLNLNQDVTVGRLLLGGTAGAVTTNVGNGSSAFALTLDNTGGSTNPDSDPGSPNTNANITSGGVAGSVNIISAPLRLSGLNTATTSTANIANASTNGLSISSLVIDNNTTSLSGTGLTNGVTRTLQNNLGAGQTLTIGDITSSFSITPVGPTTPATTNNITNILQLGNRTDGTFNTAAWGDIVIDGVISNGASVVVGDSTYNSNTQVIFGQSGSNNANSIQTITVNGNNTFSGGGRLFRANLVLGHDNALGTGTFQHNGGAASGAMGFNIASTDDARTIANNFGMARNVTINGAHSLTWTGNITQTNTSNLFNLLPAGKLLTVGTPGGPGIIFTDNGAAGGRAFTFDGPGETVVNHDIQDTSNVTLGVNGSVVRNGTGLTTLNGTTNTLTYHNFTAVNGGVLKFGTAFGVGNTSSLIVNPGGTIVRAAGTIDPSLTAKLVTAQAQPSTGALGLTAADSAAAINFTSGDLGNAKAAGMSVGADLPGVTYTGTITPANSTYRLGGGGTLTMDNVNHLTGPNGLAVVNGGEVALTKTNNYSGDTTVQGNYIVTQTQAAAANNGGFILPGTYVSPTLTISHAADGASSLGSGAGVAINGGTLKYVGATAQSSSKALSIGPTGATLDSSGAGAVTFSNTAAIASTDVPGAITATTTMNNPTLTNVTDISNLAIGMTVDTPNVPVGTTIVAINPRFTITSNQPNALTYDVRLSANATLGGAAQPLTFTTQNRTLTLAGSNAGANTVAGALGDSANGTLAVNKTGAGQWVLGAANTHTGGTTVTGGTLVAGHADAFATGRSLTVGAGATARSRAGVSTALDIATLSIAATGKLDLNDGGLVKRNGGVGQAATQEITAQLKTGLENGGNFDWLGNGISSTEANADNGLAGSVLYGVGVIQNNLAAAGTPDGTTADATPGGEIYTSFKGRTVGLNDTLVRYTYMGDADLSGNIDGTDYSLIDAGFAASLAGWLNGDFDYSGSIDGTDYALIDNAFASQVGPLSQQFQEVYSRHAALMGQDYVDAFAAVQSGAVPEPGTLGILALAGTGLLVRRNRRKK